MTKMTFLGHSSFKVEHNGSTIFLDPWFNGPSFPENEKNNIPEGSIILVSHGHFDHFETALELAKNRNVKVVTNFDIMLWMNMQGIEQEKIIPMNKGGSIHLEDGITINMVPAEHSSTIQYDGKLIPGGEPVGYVIQIDSSNIIYYAGDTAVFSDMKLITEFFRPNIAILPVGGLFTMSGKHVAYALDNLLTSVKLVIPSHYGTFDFLSATPEEVKKFLIRSDIEFLISPVGNEIFLDKIFQTINH